MASTGAFATSVATGSALARKLFSVALFSQTQKAPGFSRSLTGAAPTEGDALNKLRAQTDKGMPIVRVTDLTKTAGDKISVDMFGVIGGSPIMGDTDAEGTGVALSSSSMDIAIDNTTKVVDVGGKMSQQRTVHDLRQIALANLVSYFARFEDQSTLVHLAGARGFENGADWVVPLASDGNFATIMVNSVKAPTYNRHFVVSGSGLSAGGVRASTSGSIATTDKLTLDHIDALRLMLDEQDYSLQPVQVSDDPAAADEPMWVLYLSPRQYSQLLTSTASNNIRAIQQNAWNRASYGSKSPLFKGEVGLWNGILIKKLNRAIRFTTGSAYRYVASGDASTATETAGTLHANITSSYAVDRGILLGAQALGSVYGKNKGSDYHVNWLENPYNFDRALEVAGDTMGGKAKLRFNYSSTPTDHGVVAIDSVVAL